MGTTTFDPNVTSKSFNLMLVSDELPELDEKLVIVLTSATLVGSSDGECCRSNHNVFGPCTSKKKTLRRATDPFSPQES